MSKGGHAFHEIYLHLNWHCHLDQPMLMPQVRAMVYAFVRGYCHHYPGVFLQGIGGTRDHVHLAVEIEPTVVIDQMVGKLKGASAREANKAFGFKALQWQRGYGVASFAKKNLPGFWSILKTRNNIIRAEQPMRNWSCAEAWKMPGQRKP
jgi:REP element-mobilizing transposase RayT